MSTLIVVISNIVDNVLQTGHMTIYIDAFTFDRRQGAIKHDCDTVTKNIRHS